MLFNRQESKLLDRISRNEFVRALSPLDLILFLMLRHGRSVENIAVKMEIGQRALYKRICRINKKFKLFSEL